MPGLVRKLLVFAVVDGLILQPLAQKGQRPAPAAKIAYSDNNIGPVLKNGNEGEAEGKSFEAFGVVGLLTVSNSSFLVSIVRRQQVAQIQGKPIYVITEVALTPLASKKEADASIAQTHTALRRGNADRHEQDGSDSEEEDVLSAATSDDVDDEGSQPSMVDSASGHKKTSSVAEDVIFRKGGYGRFAKEWFSKKGWTAGQRRNLGMTESSPKSNEDGAESSSSIDTGKDPEDANIPPAIPKENVSKHVAEPNPQSSPSKKTTNDFEGSNFLTKPNKSQDVTGTLLPKLLRTTLLYFGSSRSFFFSYEYDITRNFMNRQTTIPDQPLYTQVDPLYFWNMHVIQPFIDAGQDSFVLPLMQGFIGQRDFNMDTEPPKPIPGLNGAEKSSMEMVDFPPHKSEEVVDVPGVDGSFAGLQSRDKSPLPANTWKSFSLTLISRRSIKRAGLRYLRRGVDEEGHTANGVETEQILSDSEWKPSSKIHSFVQIRGSVPIFFSQSPYSFKPVPQIQHSEESNYQAFSRHFENISSKYGSIQAASLVEKHGPEFIVGDQYAKFASRLNDSGGGGDSSIGFEWFDFHAVCRGMKFENVSLLMEMLGHKLDSFGFTVETDGSQLSKQSGVLRTNCMDCLDRTNVVQNSFGKRALEKQLKDDGIDVSLQQDQTLQWFNMLWADNGDAISKQYASTAALKGDFTRTRKRDYKGALTDMGLSISRFYSGIVNDYFSQASIDFLLGNVTADVFEDFETNLMSRDPAVSMPKMRQQAIESCQKLVVADEHEEFIGGWALLTPQVPNTIKSSPFEEVILLLTDSGLYSCRFDWNMEKVSSFERVSLQHILNIKYGTYVTSTLSTSQSNEQRNVGFVVTYQAGKNDISRVNTRSIANVGRMDMDALASTSTNVSSGITALIGRQTTPENRVLAFKALTARSAAADSSANSCEIDQVMAICSEIERMALLGQVLEVGSERIHLLENEDIISLAEARKSTGLLEQLGHSFKKLIWA